MTTTEVTTLFGDSTNKIEDKIKDMMGRGCRFQSISLGFGPSPAKVAGLSHGGDAWHAIVIYEYDDDA